MTWRYNYSKTNVPLTLNVCSDLLEAVFDNLKCISMKISIITARLHRIFFLIKDRPVLPNWTCSNSNRRECNCKWPAKTRYQLSTSISNTHHHLTVRISFATIQGRAISIADGLESRHSNDYRASYDDVDDNARNNNDVIAPAVVASPASNHYHLENRQFGPASCHPTSVNSSIQAIQHDSFSKQASEVVQRVRQQQDTSAADSATLKSTRSQSPAACRISDQVSCDTSQKKTAGSVKCICV